MIRGLSLITLLPLAVAGGAKTGEPRLSLGQETALRCSALFAVISAEQARNAPAAAALPRLGSRGREYFVRTTARLMDETGMVREQVKVLMTARVRETNRRLAAVRDPRPVFAAGLKPCLVLLDAEVPVRPRSAH